ncbi:unnamed protein product [Pieris brassicae]|uniref:Uncharacterized protein n=1 Tax=Pieris brassicae TaxID=7116 RepID=A0A9P0SY84_PIEBR|nr:unnamed protein product [Pieris brassicae]
MMAVRRLVEGLLGEGMGALCGSGRGLRHGGRSGRAERALLMPRRQRARRAPRAAVAAHHRGASAATDAKPSLNSSKLRGTKR